MKKIFTLSLLMASTSVFAALPPFTPHNLETYKGAQKNNMSRLRVNLTVSGNNDAGEINVSNFILCSTTSCWKTEVNKYVPVVNSSTTRGQLIADVLIPNNEQIKEVFFEPTTGKQSIEGDLKFKEILKIDPEYQGQNLYIVLDKNKKGNGVSRYFPIASTALPFNPELKYYLVDPKFNQSINLKSKSKITFPAKFLDHPQLFTIAEHNVGKKFPMLDIYPYLKGNNNLKIKLAEVNKSLNTKATNQVEKSVSFSEITSSSTLLVEGSDTPSSGSQKVPMAAAAATCASTISANLTSYRNLLTSTGVVKIPACENIAPNIHIAFINLKDARIKYDIPVSVASTATVPHVLNLRRITSYTSGIALVNGFTWDGDKGYPSGGQGTAKGFLNTNNIVRARNTDAPANLLNKLVFGVSSTKAISFFETGNISYNFGTYGYNLTSSSTSVIKNGVCATSTETDRWSAIGANPSTGEVVMVSSTSGGSTNAAALCPVFKAFGINNALRLDGGPSAAMVISGIHLNPLVGSANLLYGSSRHIAYPLRVGN
ncbi:phosphodiester glycosidase family protein [Acinetobacter radioresistens]|uniref:phosphodiester glycosidase family protein n=1 Tax=Acinetobacter radioresistens TaxID=40216 RepID=UPI002005FD76|nr:phosphodiester glycosidase family protein [Acinetobacter radioresistens]